MGNTERQKSATAEGMLTRRREKAVMKAGTQLAIYRFGEGTVRSTEWADPFNLRLRMRPRWLQVRDAEAGLPEPLSRHRRRCGASARRHPASSGLVRGHDPCRADGAPLRFRAQPDSRGRDV